MVAHSVYRLITAHLHTAYSLLTPGLHPSTAHPHSVYTRLYAVTPSHEGCMIPAWKNQAYVLVGGFTENFGS